MRLLALIPTEHSNGQIVLEQLENTAKRTGIPREILSDHGSDVKSGGELFVAAHTETTLIYDAAHHGAIVLKRLFQADDRWAQFIAKLGQTKSRLQQTPDAFLMSPGLRPKARYMNLESLLLEPQDSGIARSRHRRWLSHRTHSGTLRLDGTLSRPF